MTASYETKVFQQLKTILKDNLPWATTVDFEKTQIALTAIADHELPLVQFWFDDESFTTDKQKGHLTADLRITIEIINKSTEFAEVSQTDILDKLRDVREVLGDNIRLKISDGQMVNVVPTRAGRDFVTQAPFMMGQLQISVVGQVPYGTC